MPRPTRFLFLSLAAVAAGLATPASGAAAGALYSPTGHECRLAPLVPGLVAGEAFVDPLGYVFDTTETSLGYGTLDDGSTQLSKLGVFASDAYDRFGALFVGDGQSESTRYHDAGEDANGCALEAGGRQLALKAVERDGLEVQRRVFVSAAAGGSGARLLDTVRNTTGAPVTADVYVGDLRADHGGSLGSDWTTTLHATSSGDGSLDADDRWAVTSDGRPIASDPAIAHVWGGPGAEDDADLVRTGTARGTHTLNADADLDADQLGWAWTDVRVAPGQARSYLSWEALRVSTDTKATTQAGLAAAAAAAQVAAPLARVYEGLSAAQIGSVANWGKPSASAKLTASAPIAGEDATFAATDVDFGSTSVAACSTGTLTWSFGDGASATGKVVSHRFATQGTVEVALTVTGTCGGSKTVRKTVSVAAPPVVDRASADPAPAAGGPSETVVTAAGAASGRELPADALAGAAGGELTLNVAPKLSAAELGKRGVRPTLLATAPGTVRLVLSGGGLKIVKTKQVAPGTLTPAAMKLGPGDARRVKGLKTLQLRAKLTLAGGGEVVVARVITVSR